MRVRPKYWCIAFGLGCVTCGSRSELDDGVADATTETGAIDAKPHDSTIIFHDALVDATPEAGTDAPVVEVCLFDAGAFVCGDASCVSPLEYCGEVKGGPVPGVDIFTCAPLPMGCCACSCTLFNPQNDCLCEEDAGRVHVLCLVP